MSQTVPSAARSRYASRVERAAGGVVQRGGDVEREAGGRQFEQAAGLRAGQRAG